ncbi:hypothetical protein MesoLjLc_69360 [Mesorhizobium sp. L-8-10]|nr:hypothetical protein MesoLjLc_69360 [Mesorhizobium sp. L-8-10]
MSRRCGGIYLIRYGSCDQACSSWSSSASTSPHTPSAAVNWASPGEGRGVPRERESGQIGIGSNEGLPMYRERRRDRRLFGNFDRNGAFSRRACFQAGSSTWLFEHYVRRGVGATT